MYRIIEHFSLGRRRLELFGEDHNIRSGWLTVGKGLSSSNFNAEVRILHALLLGYRTVECVANFPHLYMSQVRIHVHDPNCLQGD